MNPVFARLAPPLVAVPCGTLLSWQYATYTPTLHALAVGLFAWTAIYAALDTLLTTWLSKTFRCPHPDCTFRVSLSDGNAAHARRWQEIAHAHPHHGAV